MASIIPYREAMSTNRSAHFRLRVAVSGVEQAAVTGYRCVLKITPDGITETVLKSKKPWTPTGVAVRSKEVFVLEYSDPEKAHGLAATGAQIGC
jgi:hypothetical protein